MPFKSRAQRRKFAELLMNGKISDKTYEEWNRETGRAKLPEYAHPKAKGAKQGARKSASSRARGNRPYTSWRSPRRPRSSVSADSSSRNAAVLW